MLFPVSTLSKDSSEILNGICHPPGPNPALVIAVRFLEARTAFSPLGIKREKDEEAQKRIAASAKTS